MLPLRNRRVGSELELYQNKEWGMKQRDSALQAMGYLDGVLANNDYVAGDSFSMADITVFAGLAFAGLEISDELQNLTAWRGKGAARPSIAG
jgi:glutathione S-transferase